jgi:hypothetical protein
MTRSFLLRRVGANRWLSQMPLPGFGRGCAQAGVLQHEHEIVKMQTFDAICFMRKERMRE